MTVGGWERAPVLGALVFFLGACGAGEPGAAPAAASASTTPRRVDPAAIERPAPVEPSVGEVPEAAEPEREQAGTDGAPPGVAVPADAELAVGVDRFDDSVVPPTVRREDLRPPESEGPVPLPPQEGEVFVPVLVEDEPVSEAKPPAYDPRAPSSEELIRRLRR